MNDSKQRRDLSQLLGGVESGVSDAVDGLLRIVDCACEFWVELLEDDIGDVGEEDGELDGRGRCEGFFGGEEELVDRSEEQSVMPWEVIPCKLMPCEGK